MVSPGLPDTSNAVTAPGTITGPGVAVRAQRVDRDIDRRRSTGTGNDRFQGIAQRGSLVSGQLDYQPATTFEGYAHDNATSLFGDLKRTVTRPRLHRRHPAPLLLGSAGLI
jgi:hypothetical protein